MATSHIQNFLAKSWPERYRTAQFYFRRGLSKFPYLPVPVRLELTADESVDFWWSRVVPYHDEERAFLDYWGHDAGDLRFLWRVLEPGMTFLDIGANEGVYSLIAAAKLEGSGRVVAFEPSPREHDRLRLHLRWNSASCARAERLAVGADAGRFTFFEVAEGGDTSRNGMRPPATDDRLDELVVESITLDEYVASHGLTHVDVMKLDVEGGELDVFRGAKRVLGEIRPVILCEVLDAAARPWGHTGREVIDTLAASRYRWFEIGEDGALVAHVARDKYAEVRNYVAVPFERCDRGEAGLCL